MIIHAVCKILIRRANKTWRGILNVVSEKFYIALRIKACALYVGALAGSRFNNNLKAKARNCNLLTCIPEIVYLFINHTHPAI